MESSRKNESADTKGATRFKVGVKSHHSIKLIMNHDIVLSHEIVGAIYSHAISQRRKLAVIPIFIHDNSPHGGNLKPESSMTTPGL